MALRILDLERNGAAWDAALHSLPLQLQDVYFTSAYHLVWQRNGDGAARGAVFESDHGVVVYPFLLRPLDTAPAFRSGPAGTWRGRYDITSAYGYGGPLATVRGEEPPGLPDEPQTAAQDAGAPTQSAATTSPCDLTAPIADRTPSIDTGVSPARNRLLAAFRAELSAWCRAQGVVSEFIRFHPLLQTELGLAATRAATAEPITPAAANADVESPSPAAACAGDRPPVDVVPANVTVWCRLSTPEDHRAALSSSTRRNLRKAERAGLTFGVETSDEAWARFIELYTDTMRRREASDYYLFPPRYFRDCRELLGDAAALLTVRRPGTPAASMVRTSSSPVASAPSAPGEPKGEIVAAAFFLRSRHAIHYHLGGSDAAALAERPNNLLFVGAMDWGAELGAKAMHLGGGFRAGGEDELFRFKAGFSPLRARFHMGRCVHDHPAYDEAVAAWHAAGGEDPGGFFPAYRAPLPA